MHTERHAGAVSNVPSGLLAAAIDYVLLTRPAADHVPGTAAQLALRLGYAPEIAHGLARRMVAAGRLIADPRYSAVKALRDRLDAAEQIVLVVTVQCFIATAPLDTQHSFDVDGLVRSLTKVLPACGNA